MRRLAAWLSRRDRCAVSVEIGFLAVPFFILLLGAMEVTYDLYVQAAMNMAVANASRAVWTGQVNGLMTMQQFVTRAMCTNSATLNSVGGLLDCANIIATVEPLSDSQDFFQYPTPAYVTGSGPSATLNVASWPTPCTGGPGKAVLIQAVYAGPAFIGSLIPNFVVSWNGSLVHPTYASSGFVNESNPGVNAVC